MTDVVPVEGVLFEYIEKDEDTIEACGNCSNIQFQLLAGGTLRCSCCGMILHAFWITEEGIPTKTIYVEERENAN